MNSTYKVGIMTLVAIALLAYTVFVVGDFSLTEHGYRFIISFYSVNGLNKGANVSMSGVKIGKVEKIAIQDDQVYVYAYIQDKKFHIRRKNTFTISTAGLMGEKFIEIMPTRDYTSPYVSNNEIVNGTDPMGMDDLFQQGTLLVQKLQELTASAKDIIGDPELKENTKAIFRNARDASARIDDIIASLQDKADSIANNLDNILQNVDDGIAENRKALKKMIANFRDFSKKISEMSGENRANIKKIISNFKDTSKHLDQMIAELNKNHEMTNNLRATIASLRHASDDAKSITHEVKRIVFDKDIRKKINTSLEDAHKLANAVDKVFVNIRQIRVDFKYMLRYNRDDEKFLSDVGLDVYPSDSTFFRFGVEDVGGEDLFNFVIGKDADTNFVKRVGIISSKIGMGFDYYLAHSIGLGFDVYDPTDAVVRFKGSYILNKNIRFELRVDDIADKKDVNFGLEYKF